MYYEKPLLGNCLSKSYIFLLLVIRLILLSRVTSLLIKNNVNSFCYNEDRIPFPLRTASCCHFFCGSSNS